MQERVTESRSRLRNGVTANTGTVVVTDPARLIQAGMAASNMESEPVQTQTRAPTILVVEDEATVAEVVEKYLLRESFLTAVVHDGAAALGQLDSTGADLVILDLMLPGIDGLEVCRRMRDSGDSTPVIMLTAKDRESDVVLGLGVGADDYMGKPFSPAELVARVKAVLRRG